MTDEIKLNIVPDTPNEWDLLKSRHKSMVAAEQCHEYLTNMYYKLKTASIIIISILQALGTCMAFLEYTTAAKVVTTLVTLCGVMHAGLDFAGRYKAHVSSRIMAEDLARELQCIIARRNMSSDTIRSNLWLYNEKIDGFRKIEAHVPVWVKGMISNNHG